MEPKTGHYSDWLLAQESLTFKRFLDVQAPYRWNMKRLRLGFTLDLGCGLGRNLAHLGGNGVGIDSDSQAISVATQRGFKAFSPADFLKSDYSKPSSYDSILCSHCLEHMTPTDAVHFLKQYVPFLKSQGQIVIITPQEKGFASDKDHKNFLDFSGIQKLLNLLDVGVSVDRAYSFPFPRIVGRVFRHNEFVVVAKIK